MTNEEVKPKRPRKKAAAKEKKPRARKSATKKITVDLPAQKDPAAKKVVERVVLPKEKCKLVPHLLLQTVEGLLIRVENLEKELAELKKK